MALTTDWSAVQRGEADLYHGTEHDHLHKHRALSFFAGLPGDRGMAPEHLLSWILVGGGQTLYGTTLPAILVSKRCSPAIPVATRTSLLRVALKAMSEFGRRKGFGYGPGARRGARLRTRVGHGWRRQTWQVRLSHAAKYWRPNGAERLPATR